MHKLFCLIFLCLFNSVLHSQKTDSLNIFYGPDEYALSETDQRSIGQFLSRGWDKIVIRSYADITDEEDHNIDLSRNRATAVYDYLVAKKIPPNNIKTEFFGESVLLADNGTEEGRALNRRTTLLGIQYPRVTRKPVEDPNRVVTETLRNGFIITYRPKNLPPELWGDVEWGWGSHFDVITNTSQMRSANLYNNTTDGDILSSVLIFSGEKIVNCKLDSPVFLQVPIPFTTCPMDSIRFFVAVSEGGKRIWQEKIMKLQPGTINGQRYMGVWLDNFCGTYNFDFKIRPGCFDIDSIGLITMQEGIKNLSSELIGLNSVYLPRQLDDSLYSIWYVKTQFEQANVSFSLYDGKRLLKQFFHQRISSFPQSDDRKQYVLTTDTIRFASVGVKDFFMLLRVNSDVYRKIPENNKVEFIYLNRANEKITVNLYAKGKKKKFLEFRNIPIDMIPFDESSGTYVVTQKLLEKLGKEGVQPAGHLSMK